MRVQTLLFYKKGASRTMQTPKMITIPEAAEILGCSNATVRRRVKDGSLKAETMIGPNGSQYFIDLDDLHTAVETVNVIPFKHEVGMKELEQLIAQSVLKSLEGISPAIGEALKEQNEALKTEISVLHDSIKAMEARQVEREAAHFDLVDKRLKELSEEPKKGFWARLFSR